MGQDTKIEWTDHTFNPVIGCQEVSPACDLCYARVQNEFRHWVDGWGPHGERRRTSAGNWKNPIKWNREAEAAGVRAKVFCASLADVFDNQWPDGVRADLFRLIKDTPNLDWQLLSKRIENAPKMLPEDWGNDGYPNVWLGATTENQELADRRIPILLSIPARVRFLSVEPMLGPINLSRMKLGGGWYDVLTGLRSVRERFPGFDETINWVIAGGESGKGARPMSIQWVRELRDQCTNAGVPFFFKQWGEWAPAGMGRSGDPGRFAFGDYESDREIMIQVDGYPRQFTKFGSRSLMKWYGKKAAGRLLDGVVHEAIPMARHV